MTKTTKTKTNKTTLNKIPGVYEILFEDVNGAEWTYIGSCKNLGNRKHEHLYHLRKGTHCNTRLQAIWNCHVANDANPEEKIQFNLLQVGGKTVDKAHRATVEAHLIQMAHRNPVILMANKRDQAGVYFDVKSKRWIVQFRTSKGPNGIQYFGSYSSAAEAHTVAQRELIRAGLRVQLD